MGHIDYYTTKIVKMGKHIDYEDDDRYISNVFGFRGGSLRDLTFTR